jgi:RimJ/RimL family protein N-acetyltransferase
MDAANYRATDRLRDGQPIEIRALKPEDTPQLLAALPRTSDRSLYRRFFGVKRHFSDQEIDRFVTLDFVNDVALVVIVEEEGKPAIIGGVRYAVIKHGRAEIAFSVIDAYQGRGIGAALLRHLTGIARKAGLQEFIAEVLPENIPMLKVFERSGLPCQMKRDQDAVHVALQLRTP